MNASLIPSAVTQKTCKEVLPRYQRGTPGPAVCSTLVTPRITSAWADFLGMSKAAWCLLLRSTRHNTRMIHWSSQEKENNDAIYSWTGQRGWKQMSVSAIEKATSLLLLLQVTTCKCWKNGDREGKMRRNTFASSVKAFRSELLGMKVGMAGVFKGRDITKN